MLSKVEDGALLPEFRPLTVGALYNGSLRGLTADTLAVGAFGGTPHTVCTALVAASHGTVTDVLNVPTDSVDAQFEHLFKTTRPNAAHVGIVGHHKTVEVIFRHLDPLDGPVLLDLTLSGPSGEDLIGRRGLEKLIDHLDRADLVSIRKMDAQLVAEMEIEDLEDAQTAVHRLYRRGANRVLLRCGQLASGSYETDAGMSTGKMNVDLYFDGSDFGLFEAPHLETGSMRGASSALAIAILYERVQGASLEEAIQAGKAYTAESLYAGLSEKKVARPDYFWRLSREKMPPDE